MTIQITQDNNKEQKIDVRTVGQKRRDALLAKDPDYFKKIGRKGGLNGGRPFRSIDGLAKRAIKKRWQISKGGNNGTDNIQAQE